MTYFIMMKLQKKRYTVYLLTTWRMTVKDDLKTIRLW